jgi:Cys-rich protein (TIGR01571 family)
MKIFYVCFLELFHVVLADVSLRKGHLTVHRADINKVKKRKENNITSRHGNHGCPDPYCETCVQDDNNPQNVHCTECMAGFGLKHAAKECDNLLNCENACVPCAVKGCTRCSALATSCASCVDELTLVDGKCSDDEGTSWDWMPGVSDPPAKAAKHAGRETVKGSKTVYNANPSLQEHLVPFQSIGIGYLSLAAVLYLVLAFGVAYCYMQQKGSRLESGSGYLPEDGFSDAICECGQSWPICMWACCCPCIRWSDTNSQLHFMNFYLGVFIWGCLTICNSLFAGLGFLMIVILGAYHRGKVRAYFGLPRSCMTGFQDVIAWLCCQPCAIAQEARHVERALGLRTNSQR